MIEKSLLLNKNTDYSKIKLSGYHRLYFGSEFCPRSFPSAEKIEAFITFCEQSQIKGTIITPFIPERYSKQILMGIEAVPANYEVVINDLGLLKESLRHGHSPVLGRLFLPLQKDSRIRLPEDSARTHIFNPDFFSFYTGLGFVRFELDNLQYPFFGEAEVDSSLRFSLFYPEMITNINASSCHRCDKERASYCYNFSTGLSIERGTPDYNSWTPKRARENYLYDRTNTMNQDILKHTDRIVYTDLNYEMDS